MFITWNDYQGEFRTFETKEELEKYLLRGAKDYNDPQEFVEQTRIYEFLREINFSIDINVKID